MITWEEFLKLSILSMRFEAEKRNGSLDYEVLAFNSLYEIPGTCGDFLEVAKGVVFQFSL